MSIPVPHTAMVLCAGVGSRMKPLTDTKPKPLIKVGNKALMDWTLDPLIEAGVKRIVVNVHHLADQVEAHVTARSDVEVVISNERGERLETGGGLAKARPLLGDDPVFVINTDAFFAPPSPDAFSDLAAAFDPESMDAVLLLADRLRTLGFPGAGDFFLDEQAHPAFRGTAETAPYAFAGVRIIKPQLYDDEPVRAFSALDVWKPMIAAQRMSAIVRDAFWLHVGTPKAVEDADFWLMCQGLAPPTWVKKEG